MELVVLTREQYRADLEEAAERGARIALASVSGSDGVVADCHGSEHGVERLVGIDVAADILGVRPSTVRDYYRKKGLPMHKPGREAMFYPSEVRAWAAAR